MKILGIGDLLISPEYIQHGFNIFSEIGAKIETILWNLSSHQELQHINLIVEQNGSEAYQVPEYILEAAKTADIIITQFCPITKTLIDSCTNLKAIGLLRAGTENINLEHATEKGILVFNTIGRNANAVADFTVGLLISECRNIAKSHYELKNGNWIRDYSNHAYVPDLEGKTAGIIGYGSIGSKVAHRLKAFGMNIIAFDPYYKGKDVNLVSLEKLMSISDFILVHYRLTPETKHMINKQMLDLMKPTSYIINTARSGLIDEDALLDILQRKKIHGAAIDVFETEPPGKDYPLLCCENITVTPHLAGGTKDAFVNSPILLAKEILNFLSGKNSKCILNLSSCLNNKLLQR